MPIYAKVEDVRKFFGICEKNNIAVIDQVFFQIDKSRVFFN